MNLGKNVKVSVMGPHHFDADLDEDLDSTYHPDADSDAVPDSDFYMMRIRIRIQI
jgi:hypothetical protein